MIRFLLLMIALLSSREIFAQNSIEVNKDTVKIADVEVVVRNATKNTTGFLYNINNGMTSFRKIGKAMQFTVGAGNFPIAGDSVYNNLEFKDKNIKVWRNGLLQNGGGVRIDTVAGKIIFNPVLISNEKIYIEVFNLNDFSLTLFNDKKLLVANNDSNLTQN